MTFFKTTLFLIVLGILLSFSQLAKAEAPAIILTENNSVFFSGVVTDETVATAQLKLAKIAITTSVTQPIYLVIDSPGGSVTAGNRFIDFANSFPHEIKPICLFCASMGYHMFQSLGERLVYSSSTLMSHRVNIGGLAGQVPGEAVTRLNDILAISNEMDGRVAKRIGISVKAYQELIYDELWLSGDSAVKMHHADKMAKLQCNEYLIKHMKSEKIITLFGTVEVKTSLCPLISGYLEVAPEAAAKFRNKEEMMKELRKTKRRITTEY